MPLSRLSKTQLIVLLGSLYCAQGLPSGLLAHALPTLMRQHGVDLSVIGLLKLLALPWVLKVVWAPWVDRWSPLPLGHRRSWILPLQLLVIGLLLLMACLPPQLLFDTYLWPLLAVLLLINVAAATQDVATDGLAVRLLAPSLRGLGNSLQVGGYKLGMIVSGSLLLLVVDSWGWSWTLCGLAALVLLATLPIARFPESQLLGETPHVAEPAGPSLLWHHYRGFLMQPGVAAWLLVVLTFKLGDSLGSPMIKPMLVDQGWSAGGIGSLTLVASLAGIGGALLGGLGYKWLGAIRSLLLFGLLQALGIGALALVPGLDTSLLGAALAVFEQIADSMSTVALFAVMMSQCRVGHEGGDFTIQASIQIVLVGLVGAFSGVLAKALGYEGLFVTAALLGGLALLAVVQYGRGKKKGAENSSESYI